MLSQQDELLIQRCIDNELSTEQRRRLMERLESTPDGWKVLACGFLEDQSFENAIGDELREIPLIRRQPPAATTEHRAHWFHHPLMSFTLIACIAFLVGVLVPSNLGFYPAANQQTADRTPITVDGNNEIGMLADASAVPRPTMRVQLQPASGSRRIPVELPLFEDADGFLELMAQDRDLFRRTWTEFAEEVRTENGRSARFLQLPAGDDFILLIPVTEPSGPDASE
jgi:hypothetical protein